MPKENEINTQQNKKLGSVSYKSILFFMLIFGFLIFGYFCYDRFTQIIPINWFFKIIFLAIGLLSIFFPTVVSKIKTSNPNEELKKYLLDKYLYDRKYEFENKFLYQLVF